MHEITSQPLDQAQYEQVRRVQGWADIKERYAPYISDESQMTSQACAIDRDPAAPIFEKDDLGYSWWCAGNRSQA
ncbi:MAG: hypothetical protein KKC30_01995 [Proteobacteria bacterium]|nr:hypothetical protein [Pseudomonadota bacterium]MBU4382768.1 hypothetical protein [Pseudomonadota bacterium]MBU4603642.1 hypothetical protein [Pseudomonadota bacterium]MCG2765283.1 hypothetical protein [Desulfarculaceae bacterium]